MIDQIRCTKHEKIGFSKKSLHSLENDNSTRKMLRRSVWKLKKNSRNYRVMRLSQRYPGWLVMAGGNLITR